MSGKSRHPAVRKWGGKDGFSHENIAAPARFLTTRNGWTVGQHRASSLTRADQLSRLKAAKSSSGATINEKEKRLPYLENTEAAATGNGFCTSWSHLGGIAIRFR